MKKIFTLVVLLFPSYSNAESLENFFKFKKFKTDYRYNFKQGPSEHSTKNTLEVDFVCGKTNKTTTQYFEICGLVKKSVEVKKEGKGIVLNFQAYTDADFSAYNDLMEKNEVRALKEGAQCDPESLESFQLKLEKCTIKK